MKLITYLLILVVLLQIESKHTEKRNNKSNEVERCSEPRKYKTALLLSFFTGEFGIDRFYLGYITEAFLKFFSFGGFGIWWVVDLFLIFNGNLKDIDGCELE